MTDESRGRKYPLEGAMLEGEVFFCHLCGKRLANEDLYGGRAYRRGNLYFCSTCPEKAARKVSPAPRAERASGDQPVASRGNQMLWIVVGAAVAAGIVAVAFIRFSGGPISAPRWGTEKEEPPPEVDAREKPRELPAPRRHGPKPKEVPEEPRALLSPRRPLGGLVDEEAVDFRTQGARDALQHALAYRRENPADLQGYVKKLSIVMKRYQETDYAEKARKAMPAPVPGEWTWWAVSGFDNSDKKGMSRPFPPEASPTSLDTAKSYQGKEGVLRWKEVKCRMLDGFVDMGKEFGHEYVVAYGFTYLHTDGDQSAVLLVGSDDGVKVWVNGQVVLERDKYRRWVRDEYKVRTTLKRGANPLLLKITQGAKEHQFNLTVRGKSSRVRIANRP